MLSPFDGTVIDPATRWMPWEPDRYGLTVVVQSDEPTSAGYAAVLVHLDRVWVAIGQHVTRGQVIGVLGRTGNAEDVRPQLHFELRAPFLIDWSPIGEDRQVDAFNPYPSLMAADPHDRKRRRPGPAAFTGRPGAAGSRRRGLGPLCHWCAVAAVNSLRHRLLKNVTHQFLTLETTTNAARSEEFLTVSEAARALGVHANTVRTWTQQGVLPCLRINRRGDRRFRRGDLAHFMKSA